MSTPRQQLAERIRNAAAKKQEAIAAIVAVRDAGQGPLFNDAHVWKSSGQNPGRRVNYSVCCLEKKTQSLRREATCCIVALSAVLVIFSWTWGRLEKSL